MTTQRTSQPGADQPLVTHADSLSIEVLVELAEEHGVPTGTADFLERLRAAAEADKPALPEGWVLACKVPGDHRTVKWSHGQGLLTNGPDVSPADNVATWRIEEYASVTPLATAASLVPENMRVDEGGYIVYKTGGTVSIADLKAVVTDLLNAAEAERGESR